MGFKNKVARFNHVDFYCLAGSLPAVWVGWSKSFGLAAIKMGFYLFLARWFNPGSWLLLARLKKVGRLFLSGSLYLRGFLQSSGSLSPCGFLWSFWLASGVWVGWSFWARCRKSGFLHLAGSLDEYGLLHCNDSLCFNGVLG